MYIKFTHIHVCMILHVHGNDCNERVIYMLRQSHFISHTQIPSSDYQEVQSMLLEALRIRMKYLDLSNQVLCIMLVFYYEKMCSHELHTRGTNKLTLVSLLDLL